MEPASIGVAVIGCGSTAHRRHLPVWQGLPGARLAAVASRDAERRRIAAERYGAGRAVADWRDLLDDPDIRAVDICVPHPYHAPIAIAAASAGKHVLCEKPLATSLQDAQAMVRAAHEAHVVLMPFHNMRVSAAPARAIDLVRAGDIGRPHLIRGMMGHGGPDASDPGRQWFSSLAAGGGAILDLGPHLFDLVAALMPEAAMRVRATLRRAPPMAVERDGLIEIEFADGALAQLTLSWSHTAGRETSLVVQGDAGVLRLCLLQSPDPSPGAPAAPLVLAQLRGRELHAEYPAPGTAAEPCALFIRAIAGDQVPLTAADGVETVRYIDAAYRSDRAGGQWVEVARS